MASISPEQCRAARALLNMTQRELARLSHVGESTVRNFEALRGTPSYNNLSAIKAALETNGVYFPEKSGLRRHCVCLLEKEPA